MFWKSEARRRLAPVRNQLAARLASYRLAKTMNRIRITRLRAIKPVNALVNPNPMGNYHVDIVCAASRSAVTGKTDGMQFRKSSV